MTITVTNVEEPGTVMLSTLQPQVGCGNHGHPDRSATILRPLTGPASLGSGTGATVPSQARPTAQARSLACTLLLPGTLAAVLRATAMYDDDEGDDKDSPGRFGKCCP